MSDTITVELTKQEREHIIRALHLAPMTGNVEQVQQMLLMIKSIVDKLNGGDNGE